MRKGIESIKRRIHDLEKFDPKSLQQRWSPEVKALESSIEETLERVFGRDSTDFDRYSPARSLDTGSIIIGGGPDPAYKIHEYYENGKRDALALLGQAVKGLEERTLDAEPNSVGEALTPETTRRSTKIFIGHGGSTIWLDLKDFIRDRLKLPFNEFNSTPVAGVSTQARLSELLDDSSFAFLIMTAEDEQADGKLYARMNVVHEAGLFQGRLGFNRAIILLENGCEEFSNIHGLGQIRFPKSNISACFEEIRKVLERENII